MLTEHDRTHRMDDPDHVEGAAPIATETPSPYPVLEEPSWLVEEDPEEMEEPRDSPFRGIWIGAAAAGITFVLVFAVPHWLGWYDIGPSTPRTSRELTPDSVISTVTAKSSASPADPAPTAASSAAPSAATPPAAPPAAAVETKTPPAPAATTVETRTPAAPRESKPAPREAKAVAAPRDAKPAPATRETKPAKAAVAAGRHTFSVQIAAFKNARQAGRVAAKAKRAGYAADVLRVKSAAIPWVVRIGGYSTREQAESARDALAKKGFHGGFIL
jgi:cell division septation protein DedD